MLTKTMCSSLNPNDYFYRYLLIGIHKQNKMVAMETCTGCTSVISKKCLRITECVIISFTGQLNISVLQFGAGLTYGELWL